MQRNCLLFLMSTQEESRGDGIQGRLILSRAACVAGYQDDQTKHTKWFFRTVSKSDSRVTQISADRAVIFQRTDSISFSSLVWDSQEIEKLKNRSTKLILRSLLRSGKFHVHSNEIFSRSANSGGGRRVSPTTNNLVRLNTQHKLYKSPEQLLSHRNHKLHCRLHSLAAHTKPAQR